MRRPIAIWVLALGFAVLAGCGDSSAVSPGRPPTFARSSIFVPITLAGVGPEATEKFALPAGIYKLAWKAHGELANFEVYVHQGTDRRLFITELPPSPSSGETQYDSRGGPTYFEVHASALSWTITISRL